MAHEIDKVALSSYLDGELPPDELRAVEEHLSDCADCTRYLRRIKAASDDFRTHGAEELPPGVVAKARTSRPLVSRLRAAGLGLALAATLMVTAGVALKYFMPGMFSQIQGMISGAANDLGK